MSVMVTRYLIWWVDRYKGFPLVITAPMMVLIGPFAIGWSVVNRDFETLLAGAATLSLGLFMMVHPMLQFRGKAKPWNKSH